MENVPGSLANLGETLGKMGINMEGMCGVPLKEESMVHILVEDETTARWALEEAGFEVRAVREVLVLDISDIAGKAGGGGKLARKLGNNRINIDLIYLAENNRIVLGVDDLDKARTILEKS
ncbi:MAG: amino acid-binding protein [Candidatus Lokiarchaeota archaeon]|nr:amino acid-binding protein [Candidatus Lokiarchaeota archaeon]